MKHLAIINNIGILTQTKRNYTINDYLPTLGQVCEHYSNFKYSTFYMRSRLESFVTTTIKK